MNRRLVYTIKRPGEDKKPTWPCPELPPWHGAFRYFDMEHGHDDPRQGDGGRRGRHGHSRPTRPEPGGLEKLTIERFRRETYKIVEGGATTLPR